MSVFNAFIALSGAYDAVVMRDEPLARHTACRVGGPAALYVEAHTHVALARTMRVLADEGVPWVILGRGSSVLASDDGYEGCVLRLGREFGAISFHEHEPMVTAASAAALSRLVTAAQAKALAGLERCAGIPGTVGGAVSMDAGTRREWIGHVIDSVVTMRPDGELRRHGSSDIEWGYRTTSLPADEVILEATFRLASSCRESVAYAMERVLSQRREAQPAGGVGCGCVFKDPASHRADELIEACGLKGYAVGQARVSPRHANSIVNEGGATATDMRGVIVHVRDVVEDRFGVALQPEVKFLGF